MKVQVGVVIPDCHAPYHDPVAVNVALSAFRVLRPDFAVCIGDFVDSYCMSRHTKKPNRVSLWKQELEGPRKLIRRFEEALGKKCRKYFTKGNHDSWVEERIMEKMPELHGSTSMEQELELEQHGWVVCQENDYLKIGKVIFTHTTGPSGPNTASDTLKAANHNIVVGHSHHAGIAYAGDAVEDSRHVCMNVGWLGDPAYAEYAHRLNKKRSWQHGFGLVYLLEDGTAALHFVPIINGRCIIPGAPKVVAA